MNLHIEFSSSLPNKLDLREKVFSLMGNDFVTGLFYGREAKGSSVDQYAYHIRVKQAYAAVLAGIELMIVLAAVCVSLVPGSGTGGPVVTFSSMPRIIWLIAPLFTAAMTMFALTFSSDGHISSTIAWCQVFFWVNLVTVGAMAVLCVSAIIELTEETSTFFLQQNGAWVWVFAIGSGFIALWGLYLMWRLWVYWHDVRDGYNAGWRVGTGRRLKEEPSAPLMEQDALESQPPQQQQQTSNTASQIGASYYGQQQQEPPTGAFRQKFSVNGFNTLNPTLKSKNV